MTIGNAISLATDSPYDEWLSVNERVDGPSRFFDGRIWALTTAHGSDLS